MAAKRNRSRQRRPTATVALSPNLARIPWIALLAWAPLLARWLTPTEGTSLGDTLWLTVLTFLAAIAVAWHRSQEAGTVRLDRLDLAVCVLAAAHVISAVVVVATEGHKRAATNMLWEWIAIGVQFALIRSTLSGPLRCTFLRVFVAVWIAQAGFGIWQHFVWYPATIQQYEQLRGQLDELESGESGLRGIERELRLREVRGAFLREGMPMSGPGRIQFEGRLKDSADPVGFFALTNTFAGFLAMLTVLLSGAMLTARRSAFVLAATAVCLGVVGWCLLLTKSRTAMCGAVAGLVVAALMHQLQSRSGAQLRRFAVTAIAIPVAASLILAVAVVSGGIDSDILSDATKSLQYRLEYWSATSCMIVDHPGLGTGPGNFRDAYQMHKLPQSSEEIADPHNFILDVTANAGLVGLLGLGFLLWVIARSVLQTIQVTTPLSPGKSTHDVAVSSAPMAIVLAGTILVGWSWLIEARFDLKVVTVCGVAAVIAFVLETRRSPEHTNAFPVAAIVGSLTALLVHLLGAGGFAMPAVCGSLLAFTALLAGDSGPAASERCFITERVGNSLGLWKALVGVATLALVGCVWSAFLPVLKSSTSLQQGDYSIVSRGDAAAARRAYDAASVEDWLSPEPLLRSSALTLQQWQATGELRYLEDSIKSSKAALERSPLSGAILRETGYRYLQLSKTTKPAVSDSTAAIWYERAIEHYPTQSLWIAEYAEVLSLAGQSSQAADAARRALSLDDLNRSLSHYDRWLPDEIRTTLEQIAAPQ